MVCGCVVWCAVVYDVVLCGVCCGVVCCGSVVYSVLCGVVLCGVCCGLVWCMLWCCVFWWCVIWCCMVCSALLHSLWWCVVLCGVYICLVFMMDVINTIYTAYCWHSAGLVTVNCVMLLGAVLVLLPSIASC